MNKAENFQAELIQNLKDENFQKEARKRYQTLAGITNVKPTGKYVEKNQFGHIVSVNEAYASENSWGNIVHTGIFGDPELPVFGDLSNTFNGSISFDSDTCNALNTEDFTKSLESSDTALIGFLPATTRQFNLPKISEVEDLLDELPTVRAGISIKELVCEVMYDLEREKDVKKRADLVMRCSRYIRLERMQENCEY